MSPLPILDLVAGIIFVFFLLSVINNSIIEIISSFLKLRSKLLEQWLILTFSAKGGGDKTLAEEIMDHPLLTGLSAKGKSTSYFNSKNFSSALVQILWFKKFGETNSNLDIGKLKEAIQSSSLLPDTLKATFQFEIDKIIRRLEIDKEVFNPVEAFELKVSEWFDSIMERIGSRFKNNIFKWTVGISILITLALNVDTISLASYLYTHPNERAKWASQAYGSVEDSTYQKLVRRHPISGKASTSEDSLVKEIDSQHQKLKLAANTLNAELPIGWTKAELNSFSSNWPKKLGGWMITIFALCLGGPFWFDVLGKLANIRSVIKPKQES